MLVGGLKKPTKRRALKSTPKNKNKYNQDWQANVRFEDFSAALGPSPSTSFAVILYVVYHYPTQVPVRCIYFKHKKV